VLKPTTRTEIDGVDVFGVWAPDALQSLRDWVRAADDAPALRTALLTIGANLDLPGDRLALRHRIHRWGAEGWWGRYAASTVAVRVLGLLTQSALRAGRHGGMVRRLAAEARRERYGFRSMLFELAFGEEMSPTATVLLTALDRRR
jgi:hypothetical protein